jgi:hypothetical protein
VHERARFFFSHFVKQAVAQVSGVIDDDVDFSKGLDCRFHDVVGAFVAGDAIGIGAGLTACRLNFLDDGLRHGQGDAATYAAACAPVTTTTFPETIPLIAYTPVMIECGALLPQMR